MIPTAEYMIKEARPSCLNEDYCTRLTFDITPQTSGNHVLSVISTGPAICYINGRKVFERGQETDLKVESFYFFKSKLERRFRHRMVAGQLYTLTLEAWATDPDILHRAPLHGKMFQGAGLRFFEDLDIPRSIESAASIAADCEYAVVFVGTTNEIESEGYDRDTMDLPGAQYELIQAVAAKNPRTIVVNFSGAPVTMTQFIDQVPAVIQAWFPGQECGHSIARILTGLANPCGHLPMSWPRSVEENPSYGNFPVDEHDVIRYEEGLDVG
jgi:beta-glucosidase